jgi:SAM-dependent methyltransferase
MNAGIVRQRRAFAIAIACCLLFAPSLLRADEHADRLAGLLDLRAGMVVAEIGAGAGKTTHAVAQRVGPSGHVYSTELDPEALAKIHAATADLSNVTVVQAGVAETGLPDACCDAIFMEAVYHHLSKPAEIDAGLLRALRPGGRLVVVDFRPAILLSPWTPKDVPANRGGHGIPPDVLRQELEAAGFEQVSLDPRWDWGWLGQHYFAAVFRRP